MVPTRAALAVILALVLVSPLPAVVDPPPERVDDPIQDGRITVKFEDDTRVRLRAEGFVSLAGADLGPLSVVLSSFDGPSVERLFTRPEEEIDRDLAMIRARSGRNLADLNGYYEFVAAPARVESLLASLNGLEVVQVAYASPLPAPPPADIPPETPDFEADQLYLNAAPGGIDARSAWTEPGGRGQGVTIIDIEYDWRDTHEDLESALGGKVCYTPKGAWIDHGTAVLGELGGGDNGYGVTGIVPDAVLQMATQDPVGMSNSVARAIDCATSLLGPGDVMLLEAQTGGPHGDYVPVEWNQAEYDAIVAATAKGIVVVEAAGNGDEDLDHPDFGGKFDRSVRDSGAIIVGAGASPANTSQPDRSRLSFSTYGSRVDVQGYGHLVTTTGYGGLWDGGGDPDQEYTSTFNGTSSASPIVTGAAAALQGAQLARGGDPLPPTEVRRILTETGTPQQEGPYSGHIGPRPNLALALDELADLLVAGIVIDDAAPLGNADGVLDPGETAAIRITIRNEGSETAQGIAGTLAPLDGGPVRVTDRDALWPDLDPGGSAESLAPHHRLTAQPEATCGETLTFTLALTSSPYEELRTLDLEVGQTVGDYASADTPLEIPKSSGTGVTSSLDVPDGFVIADVQAAVSVTHGDIGELRLVLRSPSGTAVTLHDHSSAGTADLATTYDRETAPDGPGAMNDFDGESSAGTWTLQVVDDIGGPVKPGTLVTWSLELTATEPFLCNPLDCAEPAPGEMDASLRLDPSGVDDIAFTWQSQTGVAEYRIWRSDDPQMAGEILVGQTAGSTLVETGGLVDPASLVFYQVRAVNSCEWEGP